MPTAGEIAAIVTVIGAIFSFLGISGIDTSVISGAITGIISLISIVTAVYAYIKHKNAVSSQ